MVEDFPYGMLKFDEVEGFGQAGFAFFAQKALGFFA
jgi:hypothetical protein